MDKEIEFEETEEEEVKKSIKQVEENKPEKYIHLNLWLISDKKQNELHVQVIKELEVESVGFFECFRFFENLKDIQKEIAEKVKKEILSDEK